MRLKKIIAVSAASLALSGAALGGVAMASSGGRGSKADTSTTAVSGSTGASTESSTTDTDNVQEGDQTGPEKAEAKEAIETESGSEAEGAESDGPGGHEDRPATSITSSKGKSR